MEQTEKKFAGVKDGEVFEAGGIEFIKFPDRNGVTPVVAKDILFISEFGEDNNFANSVIFERLQKEVLPKMMEDVGEDNVLTFRTDLTTLDGLKTYGELESRISLPTSDFYRENVEIFDRHNPGAWWWLATADSAKPHCDPIWTTCVSPRGYVSNDASCSYGNSGVRPFLNFVSSIFGSCKE